MFRPEHSSAFALFEWVAEGRVLRGHVLRLGTTKFGRPTCGQRAFVGSIEGTDELDRLLIRVLSATSWADLFSTR
jgi:hypothetical protein